MVFNIDGSLKMLEIFVNENIKRYNNEYNQCENPVDREYIIEELELDENIDNLTDTMIAVRRILLREQDETKKESNASETKTSVKSIVIMLTSMLGFSVKEATELGFKDALKYVQAYNEMWSGKKGNNVDGLLMGMVGCGRFKRR